MTQIGRILEQIRENNGQPYFDDESNAVPGADLDFDEIDNRLGWSEPEQKPQQEQQSQSDRELSALWFAITDILSVGRRRAFARAVAWATEIGMHASQQDAANANGLSKGCVSKNCGKLRKALKESVNIGQKARPLKVGKLSPISIWQQNRHEDKS